MIVTSLNGESEILTDYTQLARKKSVNGEYSLSFLLPRTERNEYSFDLVEEESLIEYEEETYRIKGLVEQFRGKPVKSVTARHIFYDIIDDFRYNTLTTGAKSINEVLSFIFTVTNWTFSVTDSFSSQEFENFGNDNCVSLFQNVLERYQAEFEIVGNNINIKKKIGSTIDFQFRFSHNIKTFKKSIDTGNLSTYIKGYGKQNEDGTYVVEGEYTSPMADIYGIRHAPVYKNESITLYDTLVENLKAKIQDVPEMSIELEFAILQNAGYPFDSPRLGDTVPTVYAPLNVDVDLRILEIEDYPETKKSPKVALSTVPKSFADAVMNYSKQLLDKIYDENNGRLRYNVFDDAVKRATEALNNSLTQLEYPGNMGILARDINDSNKFVVFRSAGVGVTTDGGATFPNAITADGINTALLTAGQIKTNNIQIIGNDDLFYWDGNYLIAIDASDPNKFARLKAGELYLSKGAMVLERSDGFKSINNGIIQNDFAIKSAEPPFKGDLVSIQNYWWKTFESTPQNCNFYTFMHNSRYVKILVAMFSGGSGSRISIYDRDGITVLAALVTNDTSQTNDMATFGQVITLDFGTPTGAQKSFYVRLNSGSVTGANAGYGRLVAAWKEG